MYSNNGHTREPFMNGSLWDVPTMDSDTESSRELSGDQILANGLLRSGMKCSIMNSSTAFPTVTLARFECHGRKYNLHYVRLS